MKDERNEKADSIRSDLSGHRDRAIGIWSLAHSFAEDYVDPFIVSVTLDGIGPLKM